MHALLLKQNNCAHFHFKKKALLISLETLIFGIEFIILIVSAEFDIQFSGQQKLR